MTATLIRTEKLANGLTLELLDLSRRVAADRWAVAVMARAAVAVTPETAAAAGNWADVRALLGAEVVYERKMERNFVDGAEKDALVASLAASFFEQVAPYLGRPIFPARFVRQRYREALRQQGWYPAEKTP